MWVIVSDVYGGERGRGGGALESGRDGKRGVGRISWRKQKRQDCMYIHTYTCKYVRTHRPFLFLPVQLEILRYVLLHLFYEFSKQFLLQP